MEQISIADWASTGNDADEIELRQAVHTVLHAISTSPMLQKNMLIKGGMLLAIQYKSDRYTKDIDFSTHENYGDFDEPAFIDELEASLSDAVETLGYSLDCRIQSHAVKPNKTGNYQTLEIGIGYAYLGTKKHSRLARKACPTKVSIDYSFNEIQYQVGQIQFIDCGAIQAYSLIDLVAEKYRAIIQQDPRSRVRGQDIYDLYLLLGNESLDLFTPSIRKNILSSLVAKSESRDIHPNATSLTKESIRDRSERGYVEISSQVLGELPDFDAAYGKVQAYFESLPWDTA